MKRLLVSIILLTLFCFEGTAQAPKIYIGEKSKGVQAISSMWIDSATYLGVMDTTFTPLRRGVIIYRTLDKTYYGWDGTWWFPINAPEFVVRAPLYIKPKSSNLVLDTLITTAIDSLRKGADSLTIFGRKDGLWIAQYVLNIAVADVTAWHLTGNAGTTAGTNFWGTTDNVDVVGKRNSLEKFRLNSTGVSITGSLLLNDSKNNTFINGGNTTMTGNYNLAINPYTSVGGVALGANTSGVSNIAIGNIALAGNMTGSYNIAIGAAMNSSSSASNNVAIGVSAIQNATTGQYNVAVGNTSIQFLRGDGNVGIGYLALSTGSIGAGSNNIGIGYRSGTLVKDINNSIAIGANALVGLDNSCSIGDTTVTFHTGFGTAYPSATIDIRGTLRYVDGNQSNGKVLTSDANGNAIWQASGNSIYTGDGRFGTDRIVSAGGNSFVIDSISEMNMQTMQFNLKDVDNLNYIEIALDGSLTVTGNSGGTRHSTLELSSTGGVTLASTDGTDAAFLTRFSISNTSDIADITFSNSNVGIGAAADPSAILSATSTTQGFLPPQMSTIEREAIVSPAEGLLLYNTDEQAPDIYTGSWRQIAFISDIPVDQDLNNVLSVGSTSNLSIILGNDAGAAGVIELHGDGGGQSGVLQINNGSGQSTTLEANNNTNNCTIRFPVQATSTTDTLVRGNSSTYIPTLIGTTNISSPIAIICHYIRNGNQVAVTGSAGVTTTLAVASVLSISLPYPSNMTATTDASGVGQASSAIATNAYVEANATSDLAELKFIGLSIGGVGTIFFSFTYTIK